MPEILHQTQPPLLSGMGAELRSVYSDVKPYLTDKCVIK